MVVGDVEHVRNTCMQGLLTWCTNNIVCDVFCNMHGSGIENVPDCCEWVHACDSCNGVYKRGVAISHMSTCMFGHQTDRGLMGVNATHYECHCMASWTHQLTNVTYFVLKLEDKLN